MVEDGPNRDSHMVLCVVNLASFLLILADCDRGNKCPPTGTVLIQHKAKLDLAISHGQNNARPEAKAKTKDGRMKSVPIPWAAINVRRPSPEDIENHYDIHASRLDLHKLLL